MGRSNRILEKAEELPAYTYHQIFSGNVTPVPRNKKKEKKGKKKEKKKIDAV